MFYKTVLKPILFQLDAERAHELAINSSTIVSNSSALTFLAKSMYDYSNKGLEKELFGLTFPNPIGLAAGFDKNGVTPRAMQAIGFGFIEVGSVTALSSEGNPKPRAFRLPIDQSLINRMGLNNSGIDVVVSRLKNSNLDIPLGINIAKTNDATIHGDNAIKDYKTSYDLAKSVADYITVNISCPNTGEGKTFEDPDALNALLSGLEIQKNSIPTLVKFSVDTDEHTLGELIEICEQYHIAGYVATNTSSLRSNLKTADSVLQNIGNGGLSGSAIFEKSTKVVEWLYNFLKGKKPIIAVGGINSYDTAQKKIDAGADLLQIYSGLVFEGPGLVKSIKKGFRANS